MASGDEISEESADNEVLEAKKKVLDEQIATLGCEHEETLATRNDIALHLLNVSRYDEALIKFKEVYSVRSAILGSNHDDTIAAQSNIVRIYNKQDRLDEAVVVLKEIYEKYCLTLSHTHEKIQRTLRIMGLYLQKLEKYDEAFEIFSKMEDGLALQYRIARALRKEKIYAEKAVEFFRQIFKQVFTKLGRHSEETCTAKYRYGKALFEMKEFQKASTVLLNVLEKRKARFEIFHTKTISAARYTGLSYSMSGIANIGYPILLEAHGISRKISGPNSKKTLKIHADIGCVLCSAGKYDEALVAYKEMYEIQASKNPDNLDAYETKFIIGCIYGQQGNDRQAQEAYSEADRCFKGDYIEKVKLKRKLLFSFLMKEKDTDTEGLTMCYERYEEIEKTLGPAHPEALDAYENILVHSTKYHHLLQILYDVYTNRKDILGTIHVDTLRTRQNIADVHAKNHEYAEAMRIYREVCEGQKNLPFTISSYYVLTNLAAMLCLMKKYEESLHVYEERLGMQMSEDQRNETNLEKNIVDTLVKDDITNNSVLNAFQKLSEESAEIRAPNNRVAIEIEYIIAEILRAQRKYYDALKAFEKVGKLLEFLPSFSPDDITVLNTRNNIKKTRALALKSSEAYKICEEKYKNLKLTVGPEDTEYMKAQIDLAYALYDVQKTHAALSHILDVYEKNKEKFGPNYPSASEHKRFIKGIRDEMPKSKLVEKISEDNFDSFLALLHDPRKKNYRDDFGAIPLHYAAELGKPKYVKHLIAAGAFYDLEDKVGETPVDYTSNDEIEKLLHNIDSFFVAVKEGNHQSVTELIEVDEIIINAVDKDGNTGLHWACEKENVKLVKILITHGADYLIMNNENKTALDIAIPTRNANIIDMLQDHTKNNHRILSNRINEESGNTSFHFAARRGQLGILKDLLKHNTDPTIVNEHGYTPLHMAAYKGNIEIVESLLRYMKENHQEKLESFVQKTNTADGTSALHIASTKRFTEIVDLLVEYGADIHQTLTRKYNPNERFLKRKKNLKKKR